MDERPKNDHEEKYDHEEMFIVEQFDEVTNRERKRGGGGG